MCGSIEPVYDCFTEAPLCFSNLTSTHSASWLRLMDTWLFLPLSRSGLCHPAFRDTSATYSKASGCWDVEPLELSWPVPHAQPIANPGQWMRQPTDRSVLCWPRCFVACNIPLWDEQEKGSHSMESQTLLFWAHRVVILVFSKKHKNWPLVWMYTLVCIMVFENILFESKKHWSHIRIWSILCGATIVLFGGWRHIPSEYL